MTFMILTVLTLISFLISSITSSSLEDLNVKKFLKDCEENSIEMTVMPNVRTSSARKCLSRIKSLSPRSGAAQSFFKSSPPVPIFFDNVKVSDLVDSDDDENDSTLNMSNVSESFLEDLGLRSRPSTPSLPSHSPSFNLRKVAGSPLSSSSLKLFYKRRKSEEFQSSSSSEDFSSEICGFESSGFESYKKGSDYQFDYVELEPYEEYNNNETKETEKYNNEMEIETVPVPVEEKKSNLKLSNLPEFLLANILEFCSDTSLLEIRLVDKKFKDACDIYLNFLANMTLKPTVNVENISFELKYHLSSTMMPFFKNQPQIRDVISLILNKESISWNLMSLNEIFDSRTFKKLAIFSDDFIKNILLPNLGKSQISVLEPSPIFLLGEALLKSKRFALFENQILPILNRISREMFLGIPPTDFLSPNFLNLAEGQKVLGSTLHTAISYNLNFTVRHLIKLQVDILNSKNHFGVTGLLKIIEYLGKNCISIQVDEENIEDWLESVNLKFIQGNSIQKTFLDNSFLVFEMFLGILNQISEIFKNQEEMINFLGFNQEYKIIFRVPNGNYYQRDTTLLHELVQNQQYDLIYTLGFYFGDFIKSLQDINPLHMAAEMNDPALVAILLKFYPQIDVNSLTSSGQTAIGLVVGKQMKSLKVLLKDPKANPNLHNSVSPLIRSIEIGNIESVQLLLNHPSIDIHHKITVNSKILSPLGAAVARGRWDVLHLLLSNPNNKFNIDQDSTVMQNLKEAEKALLKYREKYYDLIIMVRHLILPTIEE